MQFRTSNYKITMGILGEKFVSKVLESIYRKEKGFYVEHQNWAKNYNYGNGLDVQVREHGKPKIDVEVKNWKLFNKPYGMDVVKTEILERFENSKAQLKLLVITFVCLLSKKAFQLLEQYNIKIIEIGNLITRITFRSTFNNFKHYLKQKLAKFFDSCSNSSSYLVSSSSLSFNSNLLLSNNSMKHDTNIEKSNNNSISEAIKKITSIDNVWRKALNT